HIYSLILHSFPTRRSSDLLDTLGLIAFAISGSLAAMEKKMDFFGVFIIALVTAIGGGTLRDVLIGNTLVTWLQNLQTFYIILGRDRKSTRLNSSHVKISYA